MFFFKTRLSPALAVIIGLLYLLFIFEFIPLGFYGLRIGDIAPQYLTHLIASLLILAIAFLPAMFSRFIFIKSDLDYLLNFGLKMGKIMISGVTFIMYFVTLVVILCVSFIGLFSNSTVPGLALILFLILALLNAAALADLASLGKNRTVVANWGVLTLLSFSWLIHFPGATSNIVGSGWQFSLLGMAVVASWMLSTAALSNRRAEAGQVLYIGRDDTGQIRKPLDIVKICRTNPQFNFSRSIIFFTQARSTSRRSAGEGRLSLKSIFYLSLGAYLALSLSDLILPMARPIMPFVALYFFINMNAFYSMISINSLIHERVWVGFNAADPAGSIRSYILGRTANLAIINSPLLIFVPVIIFVHSYIPFGAISTAWFVVSGLVLLIPFYMINLVISFHVLDTQFKTEYIANESFGSRLILSIVYVVYFILFLIAAFYLEFMIVSSLVLYAIAAVLLFRRKTMARAFFRLVEHGFS